MDESFDSVSLSPTQLLGRLQQLRLLQEAAREKLQKQRQRHQFTSSDTVGSIQELLSHFSTDSTSYRTFQNLLLDSNSGPFESSSSRAIENASDVSRRSSNRIRPDELIDGIDVLNLSQESQRIIASPSCGNNMDPNLQQIVTERSTQSNLKKFIELEEMPILSPRQDFESLVLEKIQKEKANENASSVSTRITKKAFLKRGEGLSRFGLKKDDLIIQNTKSLPWKRRSVNKTRNFNPGTKSGSIPKEKAVEVLTHQSSTSKETIPESQKKSILDSIIPQKKQPKVVFTEPNEKISCPTETNKTVEKTKGITLKKPPPRKTTKTWATILTQEQDAFLRQLKQSAYYKNFESPAKSITSEASCDESFHRLQQEKEIAEQNIFELLENKVSNASFCSESSFLHRFIRNKPDCSGDNTPMLLQRCIANNPQLLQLFPPPQFQKESVNTNDQVEEQTINETCESECTACDQETCSNTSTCCTCRTVQETNNSSQTSTPHTIDGSKDERKPENLKNKDKDNLDQTVTATDGIKAEMADMNAKLVTTTELLKDRLHELEDEIEMFRQENANLTKVREELDAERQRFYEEKSAYEQKMNEDKVLSEYYLAEEKEKLAKQKQVYERYVREMKGRLNRKEKDEVTKLKKEIEDLKEEFRQKDARSTSSIARLRNQLKVVEKEKKDFQEECEKLKKENRRIQHINTNTRRLSNLKYLAEINKKLSSIDANDKMVKIIPDDDAKYKSIDIENRARAQRLLPTVNHQLRVRAKSVPNLTVTSRYAKYFSQRDAMSHMERDRVTKHVEDDISIHSDDSSDIDYKTLRDYERTLSNRSHAGDGERDSTSEISAQTVKNKSQNDERANDENIRLRRAHSDGQQLTKSPPSRYNPSVSSHTSKSKSPIPPLDLTRCGSYTSLNRSKSPISILSNKSSISSRKSSGIHEDNSPVHEIPADSMRTQFNEERLSSSSVTQVNLNPTEIKRPDGSRELRFPNGNVKIISEDGKSSKFMYYNGDIKETFYDEGKVKYYYAETKTYHTTFVDGLELLQFPDGQVEKRYADGSVEIRLPNGSIRYTDPRNEHISEEWRFPDGSVLSVSRDGEQVVRFPNGQVEVHAKDHKRREFPDGTVKLVYSDGTSETRYASGRVRIKDAQGILIMDSATSR